MSNSTPRGLPGFLRRSMRSDMMDDDEYNATMSSTNITNIDDSGNIIRHSPSPASSSITLPTSSGTSTSTTSTVMSTPNAKSNTDDDNNLLSSLDTIPSQEEVVGDDLDIPTRYIATASATKGNSNNVPSAALTSLLQSNPVVSRNKVIQIPIQNDDEEDATTTTTTTATSTEDQHMKKNDDQVAEGSELVDQIDYKFRFLKSPATNLSSSPSDELYPDHENSNFGAINDESNIETNQDPSLKKDGKEDNDRMNTKSQKDSQTSSSSTLLSKISSTFTSAVPTTSSLTSSLKKDNYPAMKGSSSTAIGSEDSSARNNSTNNLNNESTSAAENVTQPNASTSSKPKKNTLNYKEIEFEKAITEPVVNIAALRKLGWNGIPVRINTCVIHNFLSLPSFVKTNLVEIFFNCSRHNIVHKHGRYSLDISQQIQHVVLKHSNEKD